MRKLINLFYLIYKLIKKRKFNFFKYTFYEIYFDLKYKTNTNGITSLGKLNISSPNIKQGVDYMPTSYCVFMESIKKLPKSAFEGVFIDFGCGKGRALMLASLSGFKTLIGLDFSRELLEKCQKNIDSFKNQIIDKDLNITLIHTDATHYNIPENSNVFFFYNPFSKDILNLVIQKIINSLNLKPREAYIIYINPVYSNLFSSNRFLVLDKSEENYILYKIN